jgi:hypothetical protein
VANVGENWMGMEVGLLDVLCGGTVTSVDRRPAVSSHEQPAIGARKGGAVSTVGGRGRDQGTLVGSPACGGVAIRGPVAAHVLSVRQGGTPGHADSAQRGSLERFE